MALGGGYAIANGLGASVGWAAAGGWGLGVAVFLLGRRRSYAAGFRVERNRAEAVALRENDPDTYWQIAAQADGGEAEAAARRDPDAYVAIFLSHVTEAGFRTPEATS